MIDILTEQTASLSEAAKWDVWPRRRGGKRPSVSFLYRMAKHGRLDPQTDRRVRLETIRVCGSLVTSKEAVARFVADMNGHARQPPTSEPTSDPKAASRALAAAERLEEEGF